MTHHRQWSYISNPLQKAWKMLPPIFNFFSAISNIISLRNPNFSLKVVRNVKHYFNMDAISLKVVRNFKHYFNTKPEFFFNLANKSIKFEINMIQIQYLDGKPPGNEHGLTGDSKFCHFFMQISRDQYQTHNSTKKRTRQRHGDHLPASFIHNYARLLDRPSMNKPRMDEYAPSHGVRSLQ